MKKPLFKRVTTLLLILLMAFNTMPARSVKADSSSTWEKVSSIDAAASSGKSVAITMTASDGTTYILPTAKATSAGPVLVTATKNADGYLVAEDDEGAFGWTVASEGDAYTISSGSDYLYVIANNNGVRVNSKPNQGYEWSISSNYLTAVDPNGDTRYMGLYLGGTGVKNWRCYTSINNNIKNQTLEFWTLKEDAPVVPDEPVLVSSLTLDQTSLTLEEGKTSQLNVSVSPENADNKEVAWSSSDSDVATVDATGLVTAIAEGTATITVSSTDGTDLSAQCAVTVTKAAEPEEPILVSSLTLDQTSLTLEEGKASQLNAAVSPENASDKSLNWISDDETVATVDATGLVTAVAEGTATITVSTKDGSNLSAQCAVTVTKATEPEEPEDIKEGLVTDLSQLKDGSKVVIYNDGHKLAMTSDTYRDWYLMPSTVTIQGDKVIDPAENLIWEVSVNENGTYTFKQGDKTVGTWLSVSGNKKYVELTSNASQSGLDNKWKLTECDSDTHKYYMNTALEGDYGPIYLQVYSQNVNSVKQDVFCGYSTRDRMNVKDYGMQFYLVEEAYSVTVSETEHGTVSVSSNKVKEGETVTITVTPDDGYELESLLINGVEQTVGAGGILVYTVTESITIKATFVEKTGLITDLSQLKDGDTIVIYNESAKYAMSNTTKSQYYRDLETVTIQGDKVINPADTALWTVGITTSSSGTTYTFTTQDGHVLSAGTYNSLPLDDQNREWTIEASGTENSYYIINVGRPAQYIEYYAKYSEFSSFTFNSGNKAIYLMKLYKYVKNETPVDPEPTNTYGLTNTLETGDKVIIYNPQAGRGVTSTMKNTYNLDGFALTPENNVITTDEASVVWDVTVNDDGTYTFTQGSKVLGGSQRVTEAKTFNNIVLTDPAASKWTAEMNGTNANLYLGELPSSKTGGHVYLEWSDYNGSNQFQLYDYANPGTNGSFVYSFYKQGAEPYTPEEPTGEEYGLTSTIADGDKVIIFNENHKLAVGNSMAGYNVAGVSYTPVDGIITTDSTSAVWTVVANSDDTYSFVQGSYTLGGVTVTGSDGKTHHNLVLNGGSTSSWTLSGPTSDFTYYPSLEDISDSYGTAHLEYYKDAFSLWTTKNPSKETYGYRFYKQGAEPEIPEPEDIGDLVTSLDQLNDAYVAIYSPGHGTAMSSAPNGDWYLKAQNATIKDNKVINYTKDMVWHVVAENGWYRFEAAYPGDPNYTELAVWPSEIQTNAETGKKSQYMELTTNPNYNADTQSQWKVIARNSEQHTWYITNPDLKDAINNNQVYVEAFTRNGSEVYSGYSPFRDQLNNGDSEFALQFYLLDKEAALDEYDDGEWDGVLTPGEQYVIYNNSAEKSLGLFKEANYAFDAIDTTLVGNLAKPGNGAYAFTVSTTGRYYIFEVDGKYLATNNDEELFFADLDKDGGVPENAKWYLSESEGWYLLYNKVANYRGTPVCIEYFSSVFSGWTFNKKNDVKIYQFRFYKVTDDTIVIKNVVQDPSVIWGCEDTRYLEQDYYASFTLDDLADEITDIAISYVVNGRTVEVTDYEVTSDGKGYSFTISAEDIDGDEKPGSFKIVVDVTNSYDISYSGEKEIEILDEPFFYDYEPSPNTQTGDDKRPVISVKAGNVGEDPTFRMTINDEEVTTEFAEKTLTYTPTSDMEDGRIIVKVTVTRKDGKKAEKTWSFYVGTMPYQLFFGQLHSHTTYSDGSGTLETALNYVASLPESANVDFVAFTDHSNYFDTTSAANPADAMNDASLMYPASAEKWNTYKQTVANFNAKQNEVVAIAGFEMTWSGGPGHINSYNTQGIVSRNNTALNNKSLDAGMRLYYDTMNKDNGETLHQFNHPGTTFGNFKDFSYWSAETDKHMFLVEVGNGEGQIGAGGYYPSYEQYIMALDKGWHLAPTNNQDNHKGRWGNANDARDVVLTNDFSEQGIYDAIRALRVYATEDKNLEITYTANGMQMGTVFPDEEMPDMLNIEVTVYDPDSSDSISKVELVSDHGRVVYTWTDPEEIEKGYLTAEVVPTGIYYFVRVTQADGDLAVTAPIWVDSVLDLGIENVAVDPELPYVNEDTTLTATLYNHEDVAVTVKSIIYMIDGEVVLATDTTEKVLPANGTLDVDLTAAFPEAKHTPVTLLVVFSNGTDEMTQTRGFEVNVLKRDQGVTPISTVRKNKEGSTFTIEGVVTSNASGYDKDTAFFDCIYVQDATGGICAFPVSGEYKIGDKVRIIGYTDDYQGEPELQVVSIEVIGEGEVEPTEITASQLNNRSAEGKLVTISGVVDSYEKVNGLVQTIMVRDADGRLARIFIDGYITTAYDVENLTVGAEITATGLASYDNTFNAPDGPFPRIRIRDRKDVVCTIDEQKEVTVQIKGNYATPGYDGTKHEVDGYTVVSISNSEYTEDDFTFTGTAHAEGVNACDNGNDRIMMGLTPEMFTNKNSAFIAKFEIVEDGYLEIMRRELFVSVDSKTKGFGEEDPEYTVSLSNQVEGEDGAIIEELDLANNLTREEGEEIGTYKLTLRVPNGAITNYIVNVKNTGTLTITKADLAIRISGNQAEYVYDGTAKKVKGYTVEPELPDGVLVSYKLNKLLILNRTNVGVSKMNLAAEQFVLEGPMAGNYNWTIEVVQDGMLTITPAPLDINVIDQTYVFNGETQGEHDEPLSVYTDPEDIASKIEVSGLLGEDKVTYLILDGARRDVGEYDREIDVTHISINDVSISDEKSNYFFQKQTGGKLTITPAKLSVTVTGNTARYIYDGKAKTVRGYTVDQRSLPENVSVLYRNGVEPVLTAIKVGKYERELRPEDFKLVGTEAGNYEATFTVRHGLRLEIVRRPLTIVTGSATKIYDGAPLTNLKAEIRGELAEKETAVVTATGSRTAVGSSPNTYRITWGEKTDPENYEITAELGTLTISRATPVTPTDGGSTSGGGTTPGTVTPSVTPVTPSVTPSEPEQDVQEPVEIPEAEVPQAEQPAETQQDPVVIPDTPAPQAEPEKTWSVVNLLAAITSVATAIAMTIGAMRSGGNKAKLLSLIPGIGSVTAYALTEDMGGKMTAVDKFTPLMLGIAAIGIILAFLTRNRDE